MIDIAVIPGEQAPRRFAGRLLFEEDFVLAMAPWHSYLHTPCLEAYCRARHLVVSFAGDPHGFVDEVLKGKGLARDVVLTVPNFMFACALIADAELICAIPRRLATGYADRLGFAWAEPPLPLGRFRLHAFASRSALADQGVAWLFERLIETAKRS